MSACHGQDCERWPSCRCGRAAELAAELEDAAARARVWLMRHQTNRRTGARIWVGPDAAEAAAIADFIDRLVDRLHKREGRA